MYSCKYCGKEFKSEYSVSRHISGCKEYYIQRDGDLSKYYEKTDKLRQFYANKRKQKEQEKLIETELRGPYVCENCGKEHNGIYGSGRFCSKSCARSFSTKQHREEINQKISKSIQEYLSKLDPYKKDTDTKYECEFCGFEVKTRSGLESHTRACKKNPLNLEKKIEYDRINKYKIGNEELDKTIEFVNTYLETHVTCEICGRTVEESINSTSNYRPRRLCVDHNHETKQFRGVLCPRCNSFLGWYEKFKINIETYLNTADGRSASQSAS